MKTSKIKWKLEGYHYTLDFPNNWTALVSDTYPHRVELFNGRSKQHWTRSGKRQNLNLAKRAAREMLKKLWLAESIERLASAWRMGKIISLSNTYGNEIIGIDSPFGVIVMHAKTMETITDKRGEKKDD